MLSIGVMRFLRVCLILLFLSRAALAAELIQLGETVRSFGMGGVRVYGPNDAGTFLSNPAALSYMKGMNLEIFNMNLGVNGVQAYNDFKNVNLSGPSSFSQLYGKHLWVGGQGYASFTLPYFGFAAYDQAYIDFLLHNPAYPTLDMTYLNDYALALGGSIPLGPGGSFGITAKRINRVGGPQQIGPSILNSATLTSKQLIDQFQNKGSAYGLDMGLMYKLPVPLNPTLSLAWQDVGSTAFIMSGGSTAPERIKDNLTMSATFEQELLLAGIAGGIEYRHITDNNEQFGKKVHLGAEVSLLMFDFRAGFYQGYTTYGAGLDLWLMQLDVASYTVERGAYPGQTPDQRLQFGLNMNFSFDPDFNLTDMGGKKRRLKQRR